MDSMNDSLFYRYELLLFCGNCSGSHQDTKTQRINMSFTPLSKKPARHRELRQPGRGRTHCKKSRTLILVSLRLIKVPLINAPEAD